MPQFVLTIYEQELPGGMEDMPPEVLEQHGQVEDKIKGIGGKIVAPYAPHGSSEARSVRGESVTKGPFHDVKEQVFGFFIVEARDTDHAVEMAKFVPSLNGGVEIRPLLGDE